MKFKKMAYPYIVWMIIFILIPMFLVAYYSVTKTGVDSEAFTFSLESFGKFFQRKYMLILLKSLIIAFKTTVVCLLIGYPMAYIISRLSKKVQPTLMLLIMIPMWMNFLLRTYSWITILSKNGILNSALKFIGLNPLRLIFTDTAVIIVMVYNFLPFMVLPIYTILSKIEKDLEEASWDLGANKMQTFWKVIFPMSMPGVISGITMVFVPCISTFEITTLLGGGKVSLIGNVIEQQFRVTGNWHFGSSMSMVLMVLILISIYIMNKFGDESEGGLW